MKVTGVPNTALVVALMILSVELICLLPIIFQAYYIRLQHMSQAFYENLAEACNTVMVEHPAGTNEFVSIQVKDPSLPLPIRNLHPLKLYVSPKWVWMLLDGNSRTGIGLEWKPTLAETNIWQLDIVAESLETVIYSTQRTPIAGAAVGRSR